MRRTHQHYFKALAYLFNVVCILNFSFLSALLLQSTKSLTDTSLSNIIPVADTTGFFFDNAWISIYSLNWLQLYKVLWFTTSFTEFKLNVSKPVKLTCLLVASSPAIRDSIVSGYLQTIFIWSSLIHQFFYLHHTGCFEKNDFTSKLVSSIWTLSQCKLSIVVRSSNGFILMIKHIVKPVDAPYHACGIVISYVLDLVLLSSWFEGRNVHLTWGGFPVGMGYSRTSISNTNPFRNTFLVIVVLLQRRMFGKELF